MYLNIPSTFELPLSCPGMGRAVVKIGHSNLRCGSKELITKPDHDDMG